MANGRTRAPLVERRSVQPWGAAIYLTLLTAVVTAVVWLTVLRQYLDGYCTAGPEAVDGQLQGWGEVRCEYGRGPLTVEDSLPLLWSLAALVAGLLASVGVWALARSVVRRRTER